MNDLPNSKKDAENQQNSKYTTASSVYVREDDQDWGSAGMNNIEQEYHTKK